MPSSNQSQTNNEWQEIETICLQNEPSTRENHKRVDEIGADVVRHMHTTPQGADLVDTPPFATLDEKLEETLPKGRAVKTMQAMSPFSDETPVTQMETEDKESLKTRYSKGSRRPSIDTLADGRSITSQSDTRSYREKLKDRIHIVKERAGVSAVSTAHRGMKYIQKNPNKNALLSRITDMLLKDEADVKEALEKRTKSKLLKKRENTTIKDANVKLSETLHDQDISYETSVEFFTKMWKTAEENASTESTLNSPRKELENVATSNNGLEDGVKISTADYLGLKETIMEPVEFKVSSLLDDEQRRNKQRELISYVNFNTESGRTSTDHKLESKPRQVKNEGLFVPCHPKVKTTNVNKVYQRLVNENNRKWLRDGDEMVRLPLPLETTAYHPLNSNAANGGGGHDEMIHFEKAILFGRESQELASIYVGGGQCYVLELEIGDIAFTHHPLFCREHVLASMLSRLFEKYVYRLDAAVTKRLTCKLRALRTARDNLIKIMQTERNADMMFVHKERLAKYKVQIQEIRKQRTVEGKNDNALLMNLLSTWKNLKRIRALQGYTSSNVKLVILKSDHVVSTQEWQNEVRRHVEEMLEELEPGGNGESHDVDEEYAREKYDSVDSKRHDGEARNESAISAGSGGDGDGDDAGGVMSTLKVIQEKAVEEVSDSMTAPEEEIFAVSLVQQEVTNDNELTNAMEIQRRSLIDRSRIWFRIFYNGHEVCKSSPQSLERHFSCVFNQKFSIRVQEWPETLSVQIFCDGVPSKGIFSEHPLAEIFLPIPHSGATLDNVALEKFEFSSTDEVGIGIRHSGVGSGVPFKLFTEDEVTTCCYTTASITCKTAWSTDGERILSPPEYYFNKLDAKRQTNENMAKIQSDSSVLKEWLQNVQLDPNDPTNVPLFELLKKTDKNTEIVEKYFNVDSVQRMFDFCSEEEMTINPRFKLLSLRDRGEMEFKNIRAVPLREWEIPKDVFKSYEKRVSSPELPFDTIGLGQLEIHRAWGQHSLGMLYDRILKLCKLSQLHRNTPDVIHEEKVPDIGTLGLTFMKLLQPKRPLRPRRKGRKRIPVKGLTGQEVKVIVNVVRAFEVPIRKDVDTLTEDNISYVPVRPFVEVTFKGQTKRTVTADGPNPTWNQDLHFSLMGPNDGSFQVSNMRSFGDSLHIHLFDEIIVDILEDERIRDTTIHQRLDRNWLGSLRIPFSTLYFNHQVEGTFQLYSPPFLLGYDRQVSLASSEQSHLRNSTFLTLFIIVQPPLSPPDPIMENLECSEPAYLEQYLELWAREVNRETPHRPVKTLVTDVGGKSVCVTRFFRAISPPVIYDNENASAEMIARYVSLIPVSTSGALLFGHFNVWLTCDQTIRLLLGEREDHAILLCCFLMKLGLKAWLLFGNGIPHGHSAYVLTRHDAPLTTPVYNIWDPVTGLKYSSMDSFSPLHKVYCLINDENIWVNVQKEELIRRTNFDVSQRSDWWPAFGRQMPSPTNSVQPDSIEYTLTSNTDVHLLQDKIEKYLRDSIMKWRPTSRTIWNRYCIAALRKLLPIMEREACGLKQQSNSDHLAELQHILASHKICGFPISQAFTNIKAIIEAVRSTGVHINESPQVEFALAVYVHSYPNDVLSVWVYAVSLVARR